MSSASKFTVLNTSISLALFVGGFALWVFVTEIIRPGYALESAFPTPNLTQNINAKRIAAELAASLGVIRGDLWSERVLVDAANVIRDQETQTSVLSIDDQKTVQTAAERALRREPVNSRIWLVLATLTSGQAGQHDRTIHQLKMSYYTGPNDRAVINHRLKLVTTARALDDLELQELVRREVRTILLRAPELSPAIVAAYRKAQPRDRELIEATVSAVDPNFVAKLKSGS